MLSFFAILMFFQTGSWDLIAPMTEARQEVGVAAVEGKVYVVGGIRTDQRGSNAVDIFDTASNTWTSGPALPITVHHPMVGALGAKIYVAGGYTDPGFTPVANTYELDVDTLAWTRKADMPTRRGAGAAAAYGGRLYVFGGDRGTTVAESSVYDPVTDTWGEIARMPTPRNHHGAAVIRGKIYVVGGRPGNLATNEMYDPTTNTWTARARLPTGRSGIAVAALGPFLFVLGGEGNSATSTGVFQENEAYDADADAWTRLPVMPRPRHGIGAAVVGNRIFVPGGASVQGFGATADSDLFAVGEDLLLPQFVVGGGYITEIVISNPAPARSGEVTLSLVQADGSPLETTLDGARRSSATLTIPALASRTLWAPDASGPLRAGTVRIRSNSRVTAFSVVRGPGLPPVTVYPASQSRNVLFHVKRIRGEQRNTGVAILNTGSSAATVTLALVDASGQEVARAERNFAPGEQLSRFVNELFSNLTDFVGTMTVRSTRPVAVVALAFDPNGVITIPVTPIE